MPPPPPAPFRLLSAECGAAAALCAAVSLGFLAPVLADLDHWGIQDWDQHASYHEAPRVTLLEYGQLPLWNPWHCGGTDLLANPQSRVLAPTFPLVLALGTVAGLKVEMILFAFVGALGAWALGRQWGLDPLAAWLLPAGTFWGPLYALPVTAGMSWFLSVAYLPWALLCFERGWRDLRYAIGCGACLALMVASGGAYPLVIALTFLALRAALGVREAGARRALALLGLVVALTALLGAAKLLPSAAFLREFPRRVDQPSGFSLQSLAVGLLSRDQRLEVGRTHFDDWHHGELLRGISTDYDDVGMYVGPLVAALFLLGLATGARRHWPLAVGLGVFLWLSLGERATPSLFAALHELPVYDSMRYSERFRLVWLPCALFFAGLGLQWIRARVAARLSPRAGTALAGAVVAAVLVDQLLVTRPIYRNAFPIPPMAPRRSVQFFQVSRLPHYAAHGFLEGEIAYGYGVYASWSGEYPALLMNLGTVDCYETARVPRRPTPRDDPAYRGEAYLVGTEGSVALLDWSPNRLRFRVRAHSPGRLVVNQNRYAGWRAADGRPVESLGGLMAVAVGPGDDVVALSYERPSFAVGALVSAVAGVGSVVALIGRRRSPRAPSWTNTLA